MIKIKAFGVHKLIDIYARPCYANANRNNQKRRDNATKILIDEKKIDEKKTKHILIPLMPTSDEQMSESNKSRTYNKV